jgi:hypothetical protein
MVMLAGGLYQQFIQTLGTLYAQPQSSVRATRKPIKGSSIALLGTRGNVGVLDTSIKLQMRGVGKMG